MSHTASRLIGHFAGELTAGDYARTGPVPVVV
jgi:hypothetical protein